jgi:nicotinate-nucleotide pyrophosphorylase (carboxylating)
MDWDSPYIEALITAALTEDVGSGDVTVAATVSLSARAIAHIVADQDLVCAGLPLVERILSRLDPDICVELHSSDGQSVSQHAKLLTCNGKTGAILTGKQTVLNFLAHLSGIATRTRAYVRRIAGTHAQICGSHNSTPGLQRIEQYAVKLGGGTAARAGRFDAIVLDAEHIAAAGGIKAALDQAHSHASRLMNPLPLTAYEATGTVPPEIDAPSLSIQIAVGNEHQVREAVSSGAEAVLLRNMTPQQVRALVELARILRPDCRVEFSDDTTLDNVRAYAEAGVDFISPAALTRSATAAAVRLLVDSLE